jgi:hypothetical protein
MFWPWRKKTDVWFDGFKEGFSKGIDVRGKEIGEILDKVEADSIRKAIKRLEKNAV